MNRGRPRVFDEAEALEGVMKAFCKSGFERTTIEQLVAESGLSRSSLYNAFGDKDELFAKALDLYVEGELEKFLTLLGDTGADGMREFFRYWTEPYVPGEHRCLIQSTLFENAVAGAEKPKQEELVTRSLARHWGVLCDAVSNAMKARDGEGGSPGVRERGAMILAMLLGVAVIARNGRNEELIKAIAEGAEKLLDVP